MGTVLDFPSGSNEGLDRRLVTVMFTDMVGYTALMEVDERLGRDKRDRYLSVVEGQHGAFGGTIVQRLGDGTMGMFPSSLAAVRAGIAIQRELWPQEVPVRVGLHAGEVIVEPERLTGIAVNVAARIESFAVPGGVMISDSVYEQIANRGDIAVVELGRFRLKNVGRPFGLYAVSVDGLVVPDAASLEGKGERIAGFPTSLPQPPTPMLGRASDLDVLVELIATNRVVTITGPGGVGKTRLLVELGRVLAPEFLDGVAFIPLANVTDPAQLLPSVAKALDVKEAEERTLGDGIVALIAERKALLLLDNVEQIVSGAGEIARLVERCPGLRIAVTSRTPLRISSEREYPLSPLSVPAESDTTGVLMTYAAVALFVERAGTARRSFELTPDNAEAVSAICRRLDGLPLAIELAAARLRLLTPDALLERLDRALDVLTSRSRDSPSRQQTLRATIGWSYSLLTEREQGLFRRTAVFAGGFTLADLEAVCTEQGEALLDGVESLVDKALVLADDSGARLRMLQTVGDYARERLEEAGEATQTAMRHAHRYAAVAREIRDGVEGEHQVAAVERGIVEEGNLQAALDALLSATHEGDAEASETGMQMCGDLWMYWHIRGKNLTARKYAASFIEAAASSASSTGRSGAMITAGLASWVLGRYEQANKEWEEAYRIALEVKGEREIAISALCCGLGLLDFDLDAALARAGESIERGRGGGLTWVEGLASTIDGILQTAAGNVEAARARYSSALAIQERLGDLEGAGLSLGGLAQLAARRGDRAQALDLYRQSLAAFEAVGDRAEEARIISEMAWTHLQHGDPALARKYFFDSIQAYGDIASVRGVGHALTGLAAAEAVEQRFETAVRIAAAAEVYAREEGIVNVYSDETPGRALVDQARAALAADDLAEATEAGSRLPIDDAVDLARRSGAAGA